MNINRQATAFAQRLLLRRRTSHCSAPFIRNSILTTSAISAIYDQKTIYNGAATIYKTCFRFVSSENDGVEYQQNSSNKAKHNHELFEDQLLELKLEREELFGFTEEERTNWSTRTDRSPNYSSHFQFMESTQGVLGSNSDTTIQKMSKLYENLTTHVRADYIHPFTHLSPRGDSVKMVDVGSKADSRRVARARSKVILPPEVMVAFASSITGSCTTELIGPKGPIFSTAKIAGIMGAKRASELIPLCHPLPLDKVEIDIELINNEVVVECECSVTHKTGVEMEALVGASIAALTIYDMVKAVSHRVTIESTELIMKTGGKRDVDLMDENNAQ